MIHCKHSHRDPICRLCHPREYIENILDALPADDFKAIVAKLGELMEAEGISLDDEKERLAG